MTGLIIGFCGPIGCGKTTAARHLVDGYRFERRRFAGPLKAMVKALGLTDEEVDGRLKEEPCERFGGSTPRHMMQTIGTEWGRNCVHPNLWVMAWEASLPKNRDVVVDDVRFANEAQAIKRLGGTLVFIDRPGVAIGAHASEQQLLVPDITLKNNSTEDDLCTHLDFCLETFWKTGKVA